MTYSIDFRRKVLSLKERDQLSFEAVAERVEVGKASVFRWSKNVEVRRTRQKPATKIDMEKLKPDVEKYPDAYQYERAQRLGVGPRGVGYALKRLGINRKKNLLSSPSGSNCAEHLSRKTQNVSKYSSTNRLY